MKRRTTMLETGLPVVKSNYSPRFNPATLSDLDRQVGRGLIEREATPRAIKYFAANAKELTTYAYWYYLGTLWVSYTGWSDLALWRELFSSNRKWRDECLMKPDELRYFRELPKEVIAFRAHREGETDWIAYTVDPAVAARFAVERGMPMVTAYEIDREDVLCAFLRRGEYELLVLDPTKARPVKPIEVVVQ